MGMVIAMWLKSLQNIAAAWAIDPLEQVNTFETASGSIEIL